jgi:hypothetical protein
MNSVFRHSSLLLGVVLILVGAFPLTVVIARNNTGEERSLSVCIAKDCRTLRVSSDNSVWRCNLTNGESDVRIEGKQGCEYYRPDSSFCLYFFSLKNGSCSSTAILVPRIVFLTLGIIIMAICITTRFRKKKVKLKDG